MCDGSVVVDVRDGRRMGEGRTVVVWNARGSFSPLGWTTLPLLPLLSPSSLCVQLPDRSRTFPPSCHPVPKKYQKLSRFTFLPVRALCIVQACVCIFHVHHSPSILDMSLQPFLSLSLLCHSYVAFSWYGRVLLSSFSSTVVHALPIE